MLTLDILRCPVCRGALHAENRSLRCTNGHSFDMAKEGYCNLLLSGKPGDSKGDNKEMARSRRDFLNRGYYEPLARAVGDCVRQYSAGGDAVLDICCGEGYYTDYLSRHFSRAFYGFDISKNMVRLAAMRRCGASFFVANIAAIPVRDASVSLAFHLFAPFQAAEFRRVLSPGGVLVTAVPGKNHLFGLKRVLYDTPYVNDEQPPHAEGLRLINTLRVTDTVFLPSQEEIGALFQMTPYFYHTPTAGMQRLAALDALTVETDFLLYVYQN